MTLQKWIRCAAVHVNTGAYIRCREAAHGIAIDEQGKESPRCAQCAVREARVRDLVPADYEKWGQL